MDDDVEQALSLLREREMERTRPARNEHAAKALLESLHLLNGKYRFEVVVREDWYDLRVLLPKLQQVTVVYDQRAGIAVGTSSQKLVEVELDYDPDLKTYVGRELDSYRVPKPGDVTRRRKPALAVLVEKIIEVAKGGS